MKLYIKNMVCARCKLVIKDDLAKLGLKFTTVELGEADILGVDDIPAEQYDAIRKILLDSGLELLDDSKSMLIQKIKNTIIELVHYTREPLAIKFSEFLSQQLRYDYTYLANLFSETEGTTIEKFLIGHKIEHVKELLAYDQLSLTEIASRMHYSSVAHLSAQFKKVTGLTPSFFKHINNKQQPLPEEL